MDDKITKEEKLYDRALEEWGINFQLLMLGEEAAELAVEVGQMLGLKRLRDLAEGAKLQCKCHRHNGASEMLSVTYTREGLNRLADEMADVEIMLEQIKRAMPLLSEPLKRARGKKLERLDAMLSKEEE